MVEQSSGLNQKTLYTSSILKFKLNDKMQNNNVVATFTQNNIPQLKSIVESITKTKTQ